MHAQDYMVYAYLQLGQDSETRAVTEEVLREPDITGRVLSVHYAMAAAPAPYAVERGDWNAA